MRMKSWEVKFIPPNSPNTTFRDKQKAQSDLSSPLSLLFERGSKPISAKS